MSLIGAFSNGVSALSVYSQALGAVSQNIANMRAPGYRQVEVEFATLLGGIDPRGNEPGGVKSVTRRYVETQGPIEASGGRFDIAIEGAGFFVFGPGESNRAADLRFSRAGNLNPVLAPGSTSIAYLGNEDGQYLLGWPAGTTSGDVGSLRPIPATDVNPFLGQATTAGELDAILPATGTSATTQIFYVDGSGTRNTVTLTWTKTAPNVWNMQATDAADAPLGGPVAMTFDGLGNLASAPTTNIGGLFDLDVSNMIQRGNLFFLADYRQDGVERGEFIRYEVGEDGTVNGLYTSGLLRPLYHIPLALFASPSQLAEESGTRYRETDGSGPPTLELPDGDLAKINPNALELANFDLTDGFSRLIVVQRAYDTAAQVVRAVDEMTQVVRDLKR